MRSVMLSLIAVHGRGQPSKKMFLKKSCRFFWDLTICMNPNCYNIFLSYNMGGLYLISLAHPLFPHPYLHYNRDRVEREWVANNNLERSKRDSGNNCWLHGEVEIFSEFNFKFGHLGGMGGEVRKYFLDECFIFLT
jgi:hypothetical protein